jgi:predicted RNA-binding Zn-ribbon protein involved in translation (DUF1610 family)
MMGETLKEVTFCTKCNFQWNAPVRDSKGNHLTIFYCPKCGYPIVWAEQTTSKDERKTTVGIGNQTETLVIHRVLFPVPVPSAFRTKEELEQLYKTLDKLQIKITQDCQDEINKWFKIQPDVNELKKQLLKEGRW